jgi:hypothetical protein
MGLKYSQFFIYHCLNRRWAASTTVEVLVQWQGFSPASFFVMKVRFPDFALKDNDYFNEGGMLQE